MLFNRESHFPCLVFDANDHLIPYPFAGDTETGIVSCLPLADAKNRIEPVTSLPVVTAFKAPLRIEPLPKAFSLKEYTLAQGVLLQVPPCPKCMRPAGGRSMKEHLETCEGTNTVDWPEQWRDLAHLILGMIFTLQREGKDTSQEIESRIEVMRRLPFNMKPWGDVS